MSSLQDRYSTPVQTKTLPNGRTVYVSLMPKPVPFNVLTDPQITATDVVRMDVMAQNVYGSANDWWRIAAANGKADGSLFFRVGSNIIVPKK